MARVLCRLARFPVQAGRIGIGTRTLMASANTFDIVDRKYIHNWFPFPSFPLVWLSHLLFSFARTSTCNCYHVHFAAIYLIILHVFLPFQLSHVDRCASYVSTTYNYKAGMALNEDQAMLLDMAQDFAKNELEPNAADWDRDHHFPTETLRAMADLGFGGTSCYHACFCCVLVVILCQYRHVRACGCWWVGVVPDRRICVG